MPGVLGSTIHSLSLFAHLAIIPFQILSIQIRVPARKRIILSLLLTEPYSCALGELDFPTNGTQEPPLFGTRKSNRSFSCLAILE
tara:strand:+ start:321 stop:575 length:255 start_codon:yes stop_codon:yes gene_type:complete